MKKEIEKIKNDIIMFVLTLAVMTGFIAPAYGDVYFQDDFSTFTGWTYTTTSSGHFASNGTYAYLLDGQNEDGECAAYKPLERVLNPSDEFALILDLTSGADNSNTCGWLVVTLLDSSDNVVAELNWHDVQAATGYGGVDFYAEGLTAIYRTNPSGFGTEYPSFSGKLMLKRSGSEWSAWVNGIQKGPTLTLSPALTATKIQISMGHWALWNERNIEIDNLAVVSAPTPVDDLVLVSSGLVSYDRRTGQFSTQIKVKNTSETEISEPVWLAIESISNPAVTLAGADGTTADGKPYFDLSSLLGDGKLSPGESISKRVYFNNPSRLKFTFTTSVRGVVEEAPPPA